MSAKIGVIAGKEGPFPFALIDRINEMKVDGITAEYAKIPDTRMAEPCPYRVIVDRVSHVIEFFRPYLKNAALSGTYVINNPFWWSTDDKFFNYSLADKMGVRVPKTVIVPSKAYPKDTPPERLSSLAFPVTILKTWADLWAAYHESGERVMVLQEYIPYDHYVRAFVFGKKYVMPVRYDPEGRQYVVDHQHLSKELGERIMRDALLLNQILGYDMNTVEFAVKDGVPYAIDFLNPVPDSRPEVITPFYYEWVVEHMAKVCIEYAQNGHAHMPVEPLRKMKESLAPRKTETPAATLAVERPKVVPPAPEPRKKAPETRKAEPQTKSKTSAPKKKTTTAKPAASKTVKSKKK
ncbi:MAG: hypothetical protein HYU64_05135 [Armatimonadetes bacterium]|nr:hypothetical protein [Armatimonadota bacterium]